MTSYITLWRAEKYKKEIQKGNKEAILKFLNSKILASSDYLEIIHLLETLNKTLWKEFLAEILERAAVQEILRGKVNYRELGLRRKGVDVIRYFVENHTEEYESAKQRVLRKLEICKELKNLSTVSNRTFRRSFKTSEYFKKAKQSVDAIISDFFEELKLELQLSEKVLTTEEMEYLKQTISEKIKKIELI
jgi:hypothetical protein